MKIVLDAQAHLMAPHISHLQEVTDLIVLQIVAFNVTNITFKMSEMSEFGFENVSQKCYNY